MVFLGGATKLPGVSANVTSAMTLTASEPIRYHVDGEPGIGGTTVHASVHHHALRVMVPAPIV
jgi:diacylglycerol kinase family enzyme